MAANVDTDPLESKEVAMRMNVRLLLLSTALWVSSCGMPGSEGSRNNTIHVLKSTNDLAIVYNHEGMFIGELPLDADKAGLVHAFGTARSGGKSDKCMDYKFVAWKSALETGDANCGDYAIRKLTGDGGEYTADLYCRRVGSECVPGDIGNKKFRIKVEKGLLVRLDVFGDGTVRDSYIQSD